MWPVQTNYLDRSAGIGLLLLRAVFGAAIGLYALSASLLDATTFSSNAMLAAIDVIAGACLLLGFLTPIASIISFSDFAALMHFNHFELGSSPFNTVVIALSAIVAGVGLALVGPGAYSLDALLFGRREVIVETLPGSRQE